jgi:predicted TIM-barrel fold metal-dependent hydrolase
MTATLPDSIKPYLGRILDTDTHEFMPAELLVEAFGEKARPWADLWLTQIKEAPNDFSVPGYPGDVQAADPNTIWEVKGPTAPGAADINRRVEVMDVMSVEKQLMFPGFGAAGTMFYGMHEENEMYGVFKEQTFEMGKQFAHAYNEWLVEKTSISPRIHAVAPVIGESPDELYSVTESLLKKGVRAIGLTVGRLPGGISPAAFALDKFYSLLEEARCPITLHITGEYYWHRTLEWGVAEPFNGYRTVPEAGGLDPWRLSVLHLPVQNFIATMVVGGVFDRHPNLYVGSMEFAAHWIGPLARMLDVWHDHNQTVIPFKRADGSYGRKLPLRPSEYISRNVRVTPFDFEPVGEYIRRDGMEDVYCFGSDYPHVEGGKSPISKLVSSIEPLGPRVMEKFFVTNARPLLQD